MSGFPKQMVLEILKLKVTKAALAELSREPLAGGVLGAIFIISLKVEPFPHGLTPIVGSGLTIFVTGYKQWDTGTIKKETLVMR
jgi:hypothetical protein